MNPTQGEQVVLAFHSILRLEILYDLNDNKTNYDIIVFNMESLASASDEKI